MNRPRLILADDYEPAHEVYCQILGSGIDVVARVLDGPSAMEAAQAYAPDLMLLDIEMGAVDGFSVASWLKRNMPEIKIILLTVHAEPAYIRKAKEIGADGYVVKRNAVSELLPALHDVLAGSTHFPA